MMFDKVWSTVETKENSENGSETKNYRQGEQLQYFTQPHYF